MELRSGGERRGRLAELAGRIVGLGREGRSRVEIAAEVGVTWAALGRMEARRGRLAAAFAAAAEAERAWWEALPREALAAGARFDTGAWREAMLWRFGVEAGAEAGAGAGAGLGAGAASGRAAAGVEKPERPRAIYLIPDNGMERGPDGRRLPLAERRARTVKPVVEKIERLEAELARWRATLAEVEAWDYPPDEDEEDDWDEGDDWQGEDDDWSEDDESDDGDGDEGDDDEGERCEGGEPGDAADPRPLALGGESPPPGGGGEDGRAARDCARCQWAVSAGGAGAAAWVAQPHVAAGVADAAAGLRDRQR